MYLKNRQTNINNIKLKMYIFNDGFVTCSSYFNWKRVGNVVFGAAS